MAITATQLITRAYLLNGAVASGDSLTSAELSDGLNALNEMLANWAVNNFSVPYRTTESLNLTQGVASYTIGSGGDLNTDRPESIQDLWLEDGDDTYPLELMDSRKYAEVGGKYETNRPGRVWYEPTYPLGKLTFESKCDKAYELHLVSIKQFTEFSTIATESVLPTSYTRALRYNLAMEIGSELGAPMDPRVIKVATDSLKAIKAANAGKRVPLLNVDESLLFQSSYDIRSDA